MRMGDNDSKLGIHSDYNGMTKRLVVVVGIGGGLLVPNIYG